MCQYDAAGDELSSQLAPDSIVFHRIAVLVDPERRTAAEADKACPALRAIGFGVREPPLVAPILEERLVNAGGDVTHLERVVTFGAVIQAIAIAIFVYNLVHSYFGGKIAGPDPWDAWTLEWSTPSPPPAYNFPVDAVVASRRPLWDLKHPEDPDSAFE